MVNREDIESFLIRTEVDFQELGEGLWYVLTHFDDPGDHPGIAVTYQPPLVVFRADIRAIPIDDEEQLQLYRRLLELNAADLVHGAFGLVDGEIILTDTLNLEDLDFSEFRASLESLGLAIASHLPELTLEISE